MRNERAKAMIYDWSAPGPSISTVDDSCSRTGDTDAEAEAEGGKPQRKCHHCWHEAVATAGEEKRKGGEKKKRELLIQQYKLLSIQ